MAVQPVTLESFAAGVDTRSRQQALAEGAVRFAENVDIVRGKPIRANGYEQIPGLDGGHSLWSWPGLSYALMVNATEDLVRIDGDLSATVLGRVGNTPLSYCELGGEVYLSNGATTGRVNLNQQLEPWGMDAPPAPFAMPNTTGGFCEGTYQVAYTGISDGEEGPASNPTPVQLAEGQGIALMDVPTAPGIDAVCLYISDPDGTELYFYGELNPGAALVEIGGGLRTKRILADLEAERFPGGELLASWHRHVLAASGNVLRLTRNKQASLWRPAEDWYQFESPITFIGPVLDGVYVGTGYAVYFLAGDSAENWARTIKSNRGAIRQPLQSYIPSDLFDGEVSADNVALWWSTEGIPMLGRNGGLVTALSGVFALPEIGQSIRQFYWESGGAHRVLSAIDARGGRAANPTTSKNTPVA